MVETEVVNLKSLKFVQTVLDEEEIKLLKKVTKKSSIKDALRVAVLEYIKMKGGEVNEKDV